MTGTSRAANVPRNGSAPAASRGAAATARKAAATARFQAPVSWAMCTGALIAPVPADQHRPGQPGLGHPDGEQGQPQRRVDQRGPGGRGRPGQLLRQGREDGGGQVGHRRHAAPAGPGG